VNVHPSDYQGVVVSNIRFVGTDNGTVSAIYMQRVHNVHIINNWIERIGYGIYMNGSGTLNDVDNNVIAENFIYYCLVDGIFCNATQRAAAQENTFTGNVLETNTRYGIYMGGAHNTITGNTIEESNSHGIYLSGTGNTLTGNTIRESVDSGVYIDGRNETTFMASGSGNTLGHNFIQDSDLYNTNSSDGVTLMFDADDNTIDGNTITNNDRYQVYIGTDCDNNIVTSNILTSDAYNGTVMLLAETPITDTIHFNEGYATENSGTSSIPNGSTDVDVAHGLDVTPTAQYFTVLGTEDPTNNVHTIWVDNINITHFKVNVENDPGASNWDFAWRAMLLP